MAARQRSGDDRIFSEKFAHVIADELEAIARRRSKLRSEAKADIPPPTPDAVLDVTGLALSGGGVRSAAVGLGVLQALNDSNLLGRIDYLSTVSGGGYIGCSLSAAMTVDSGEFPFGNAPAVPKPGADDKKKSPPAADISDTPAVGHIRNYSNYLIPNGFRDGLSAAAMIVRGLVANLTLALPVVLALVIFTVYSNRTRTRLAAPDIFGFQLDKILVQHFGLTLAAVFALLWVFYFWATLRSIPQVRTARVLDRIAGWLLVGAGVIALCEIQPFVIEGMFQIADGDVAGAANPLLGLFTSWVKTLAAAAAPVTAVVVFFQRQLGGLLKGVTAESGLGTQAAAIATKAAVWVAGLALPLLIWVAYLYLCFWGIENDCLYPKPVKQQQQPATISATVEIASPTMNLSDKLNVTKAANSTAKPAAVCPPNVLEDGAEAQRKPHDHVPGWLQKAADKLRIGAPAHYYLGPTYWLIVVLCVVAWLFLEPNSNSLHQLYRDRLGKAFLFDPDPNRRVGTKPAFNEASRDQGRDFAELDRMKLSKLSDVHAPYHLINAALNIQGSDYANRRGRNADFFSFSRDWIGSEATGYARTIKLQEKAPELDLATAMAISGAAASSNMGANTIRPLTPTLALLNIRLGYWLFNPKPLAPQVEAARRRHSVLRSSSLYLWQELTGRLYENSDDVYLTDGGHIENLGIYELLRRRCRLIIAVDAEADSSMHFPSLVTLQRYARIDLGIRINLPWEPIQTHTLAWMNSNAGKPPKPTETAPTCSTGPHVAIGIIDYGGGATGHLVYIKSSLTGDENDYIRDYARRYATFPHETTGDQFFSEEQFEVYRALGFHMTYGFLSGDDDIYVATEPDGNSDPVAQKPVERLRKARFRDDTIPAVRAVRSALGMSITPDS